MRALPAFSCSRAKLPHGVSYIFLLRALFLPRAPHLQAAFSRKLSSCNEHVAEANFSRPHPPTPRVLCTVPSQSSKLERSEKNLTFSFGKHARTTCISLFPSQTATRSFLHFPPPRPFSPACSPPSSCFFARALQSRAQRDRCCARVVARLPHLSGNKPRRQNWANLCTEKAGYILTPPRFTSAESFSSCCGSVAALALFF